MARNVTVTFDDGTSHVYQNVPDNVQPQDIVQRASQEFQGKQVVNIDGGKQAPAPQARIIDTAVRSAGNGYFAGFGNKIAAAADLVTPDANAKGAHTIFGNFDPSHPIDSITKTYSNNLAAENAATSNAEAANPKLALAANVAGAVFSPVAKIAAPIEGASLAANAGRIAANGAIYGGLYGAGQSQADTYGGQAIDAAKGAAVGVAGNFLGAGLGKLAGAGVNAFAPRVANSVMSDADRLGIQMLPADTGGTGAQLASGAIRGGTIGEIPMQEAAQRSLDSAAAARSGVAGRIGDVASDTTGAGQRIIAGAKSFLETSQKRGQQLEAALPIHPEAPVSLDNTKQALTNVLSGFESNPQLADVWAKNPKLQATLDALEGSTSKQPTGILDASGQPLTREVTQGGQLSWQDARRLRSTIGEIIGQPSLTSDGSDIAALKRVYGALSSDMTDTANGMGPEAATAFARVNQFWRGRQSRIENVLTHVLGKDGGKSAESSYQQINRWAQNNGGNFKALAQTMRSLPEDEANSVRATILDRMGTAKAGAQNVDGTAFSPSEFVTQWNNLSQRAKSVLFPDPQHQADIKALANVMGSMKKAGTYTNHSKTGIAVGGLTAMHAMTSPMTGIPALVAEYGMGKIMSSPRLARFLASKAASPQELKQIAGGAQRLSGGRNVLSGSVGAGKIGQKINDFAPLAGTVGTAAASTLGIQHSAI